MRFLKWKENDMGLCDDWERFAHVCNHILNMERERTKFWMGVANDLYWMLDDADAQYAWEALKRWPQLGETEEYLQHLVDDDCANEDDEETKDPEDVEWILNLIEHLKAAGGEVGTDET